MRAAWIACLSILACRSPAPPPVPAPVPVPVPAATVVHLAALNDFHGGLYEKPVPDHPDEVAGGLPWLAGAVDALRRDDPDLLLLDGGDSFQGDWPVNATKGVGSVEAFDLLAVDAGAVGNHEFDYGRDALEAAMKTRHAPFLVANVARDDGTAYQPDGSKPWTMIVKHGVHVGVIGLSTQDTPSTTKAENVAGLKFLDVVDTVRTLAPQVRAAGAQILVVTGHLTGKTAADGEIGRLLTELPPGTVDVIVAGHAHSQIAEKVGSTLVLEDRAQGMVLGMADLVVGPDGKFDAEDSKVEAPWSLVHAPADPGCDGGAYPTEARDVGGRQVSPSAAAIALVAKLEGEVPDLCEPIGCSAGELHRDHERESAVGDVVADAIKRAEPQVDVAITNSGGLRADLPSGQLRRKDAQAVMPFDNQVVVVDLTGQQLLDVFKAGTAGGHGVMQISGAVVRADPDKDVVCSAKVAGKPVDPKKHYKVATSDFLYTGGDGYGPAWAGTSQVAQGPLIRQAIEDYIRGSGSCLGSSGPLPDPKSPRVTLGACP